MFEGRGREHSLRLVHAAAAELHDHRGLPPPGDDAGRALATIGPTARKTTKAS
jgi:hypothetical protein